MRCQHHILSFQKFLHRHNSMLHNFNRTVTAGTGTSSYLFISPFSTSTSSKNNFGNDGSLSCQRRRISTTLSISDQRISECLKNSSSFLKDSPNLNKYSPLFSRHYGTVQIEGERRTVLLADKTIRSPVPEHPIPDDVPFHQVVFEKCDEYKDRPALSDYPSGKSYSYTEVKDKTIRLASALSRRGYKKGDILLAFSTNHVDFTILMLACSCIGAWFCSANPAFTPEDLARQIHISDSVAIFIHEALASVSDQALNFKGFPHKIKNKFVFGEASGYEPVKNLLEDDGKAFPDVSLNPTKDVLALPYSSGTTGLPKGVMLSHYSVVANVFQILGSFKYETGANVLGLLPLYHIYGMVVVQGGALFSGAHIHFLPKFEPETFLTCMQDRKIETANLVPPLALFMAKHPMVLQYDLSHLKDVVIGAAPLGKEVTNEFVERFKGVVVQQGYGLTEMSPVTHIDIDEVYGSIGSLVYNTTAKIVDLETGDMCGPNQQGEICMKGPQMMLGYYKNEQATKVMIKEDGWLYSGDIGYIDDNGIFYVSDRQKELIKFKANQVAPAELESILLGHPGIVDACVVGKPDEKAGELPKAFVVKKADSKITEEDVVKYVNDQVTDFKKLRGGVEFINEIPKNPSGKILRRLLRDK